MVIYKYCKKLLSVDLNLSVLVLCFLRKKKKKPVWTLPSFPPQHSHTQVLDLILQRTVLKRTVLLSAAATQLLPYRTFLGSLQPCSLKPLHILMQGLICLL